MPEPFNLTQQQKAHYNPNLEANGGKGLEAPKVRLVLIVEGHRISYYKAIKVSCPLCTEGMAHEAKPAHEMHSRSPTSPHCLKHVQVHRRDAAEAAKARSINRILRENEQAFEASDEFQ